MSLEVDPADIKVVFPKLVKYFHLTSAHRVFDYIHYYFDIYPLFYFRILAGKDYILSLDGREMLSPVDSGWNSKEDWIKGYLCEDEDSPVEFDQWSELLQCLKQEDREHLEAVMAIHKL